MFPNGVVTWKIVKPSTKLNAKWVHDVFLGAFKEWEKVVANITFEEELTDKKPMIGVFFDWTWTRANAIAYSNIDVHFGEAFLWGDKFGYVNAHLADPITYPTNTMLSLVRYNLPHVARHEIGHSLGLRHNTTEIYSIMNTLQQQSTTPTKGDIAAVQLNYGVKVIVPIPRLPPITPPKVLPTPVFPEIKPTPDPIWTPTTIIPTPIIPKIPEPTLHLCAEKEHLNKHNGVCCACCACNKV